MPNIFINQPLYYAEELKLLCAYKFNMKWIGSPLVECEILLPILHKVDYLQ